MASYHRVLKTFGRSVDDKAVECDYDIHPWDLLIDGKRWDGKIRLVGFIDAFYLIRYSGESRFHEGIMIYKDDDCMRSTLRAAGVEAKSIKLDLVNGKKSTNDQESQGENTTDGNKENVPPTKKDASRQEPERYFDFRTDKGGLHYTIISLGHPIGLGTEYPKGGLKPYTIKIRKGRDRVMKKRLRRAVTQHGLMSLMHDVLRLSILTQAELASMAFQQTMGGSTINDTTGKIFNTFAGVKNSQNLTLSAAQE
ncbi:hypothetical protein PT974_02434 [Cladobotryum mycophilum]|uniref:Uncharacterized protein n=1 Tax=Cladobotryum mycophilum TaxID=491253 RepID=A0ABR0SYX4_9HYPO